MYWSRAMFVDLLNSDQYYFNPYALPPLATAASLLALVVQFGRHTDLRPIHGPLVVMFGSASLWLFAFYFMYSSRTEENALAWAKIGYLGVPFLCVGVYNLALRLRPRYDWQRLVVWGASAVSLAFTVLAFNNEFIPRVSKHWWGFYPRYGVAGPLFLAYFTLVAGASLWHFYRAYQEAESFEDRRAVRFMAFAIVTGFIAGVDFIPKWGPSIYPFGYFCVLISALLVTRTVPGTVGRLPLSLGRPAAKDDRTMLIRYGRRLHSQQRGLLASLEAIITGRSAAESTKEILEEAAQVLDIDRITVWHYDAAISSLQCRSMYRQYHSVVTGQFVRPSSSYLEPLLAGEAIISDNVATDLRYEPFRSFYPDLAATLSALDIPITREGRLLGVLTCHSVGRYKQWYEDEREFGRFIAMILATVVDMRLAGERLAERLEQTSPEMRLLLDRLIHRDFLILQIEKEVQALGPM
jgi:hypothetical protein